MDYAQKTFSSGFQTDTLYQRGIELKYLAVYLRDRCGLKPKQIRAYLDNFCATHVQDYNFRAYYKMIDKACSFADGKSNVLIQVDSLPVYKSEVDYILGLDIPDDQKKVMFSILMTKKLDMACFEQRGNGEYFMGFLKADAEKLALIKKRACVKRRMNIASDVFYPWREIGLIRVSNTGFLLDFMANMNHDGEEIMSIKQYDCFGDYFDCFLSDKKKSMCKSCGKPITRATTKIYCSGCAHVAHPYQHDTLVKECVCSDCGVVYYVDARANRSTRCPSCQKKHRNVSRKPT